MVEEILFPPHMRIVLPQLLHMHSLNYLPKIGNPILVTVFSPLVNFKIIRDFPISCYMNNISPTYDTPIFYVPGPQLLHHLRLFLRVHHLLYRGFAPQ